jgi:hypothetical protein
MVTSGSFMLVPQSLVAVSDACRCMLLLILIAAALPAAAADC